ncbi:MAG: diguanylate cyclase [Desulfofustis sp.]|jgi:two-component system cell cycle response regulator
MTDSGSSVELPAIMVVDDEQPVRESLGMIIRAMGYRCLTAADSEAKELLENNPSDIVLCDLVMPEMGGLELLEYILTNHFHTDVIIATGYTDRIKYADVIRAGAIDFIKKPIDQAELEAKLARAIRERQMIKKLEALSMRDSLTSLLNRRAYDQRFAHEIERAHRQGYPLFLALFDIDNFKGYNDTYGHDEGDKILIQCGETLRELTRSSVDLCFRLGGDEFAVLLPQTTAAQAREIIQRVMHQFSSVNPNHPTLSIGIIACRRKDSLDLSSDIHRMQVRADQAMYEAKESGKNRIVAKV